MLHRLFTISVLYLTSTAAGATQFVHLEINQQADIYEINVEMEVDAPVEAVRAILTDYDNLDRLNTSITSSRVIKTDHDGTVRVLTRMENCIAFFCMDMQKVEDVIEDAQGRIQVAIVPGDSSFRSGHASWEVLGNGPTTRVIHHAKLEPDVLIPPLMGSAVLKNVLREEIMESFENIDCLARNECETQPDNPGVGHQDDVTYEM